METVVLSRVRDHRITLIGSVVCKALRALVPCLESRSMDLGSSGQSAHYITCMPTDDSSKTYQIYVWVYKYRRAERISTTAASCIDVQTMLGRSCSAPHLSTPWPPPHYAIPQTIIKQQRGRGQRAQPVQLSAEHPPNIRIS